MENVISVNKFCPAVSEFREMTQYVNIKKNDHVLFFKAAILVMFCVTVAMFA